jgi:hypothetical protein
MKKSIFLGIVFCTLLNFKSNAQTLQTVTTNGSTTDKVITAKGLIIPSYGGSISGANKWFNVGNFSSSGDFYMTRSAYHDGIINTNGLQHQTTGTNSVAIIGGGMHGFGIAISGASVTGGQNWNWQNDLKFKVGLDGNVGIGITNPQAKLDVANNLRVGAQGGTDVTIIEGGAGFGSQIKQFYTDGVARNWFSANGNSYFNAGNLGIGITNPQAKLHIIQESYNAGLKVSGGINPHMKVDGDLAIIKMQSISGNNFAYLGTESNSTLHLITNNDPKLTILNTGNVGIGITDPKAKLDVANNLRVGAQGGTDVTIIEGGAGFGSQIKQFYIDGVARNWFSANGNSYFNAGNLGVGTVTPQAKLHVIQESYNAGVKVSGGINPHMKIDGDIAIVKMQSISGQNLALVGTETNSDFALFTNNSSKLYVKSDGNVGIGTPSPAAKFDVVGSNNSRFLFDHNSTGNNYLDGVSHNFRNTLGEVRLSIQNSLINAYVPIISNQRVLIGTSDAPSGYLLAINGNAIANKIVVKQFPWADFVFKPDYKLPPLSIVEQHIKEKGHLKDIPSEKEVAEKGIDLGSMDTKLLQKVEELALYLIDQQKQIDELKKQNEATLKQNALLMQLIKQK